MQRERLTPDRIRRFTCPEDAKQVFLWDTVAPRLAVRATGGSKSFIFESKLNRQTIRRTIGDVRAWSLDDARAEANRLQVLVESGTDPRELDRQKEAAREEAKAAAEAAALEAERNAAPAIEAWSAYLAARQPKWSARHYADHIAASTQGGRPRKDRTGAPTISGPLYPLLQLPLAQLDGDCIRNWLKDEAEKRPTQAALAFRLLRAFLNWCSDRTEYREQAHADSCTGRMARDELPKTVAKDDCLQREQISTWFAAVRSIGSPVASAYLQGLLLTGARREELAGLRWEDVDFRWRSLTIRDKVEGERIIPLTPYFASLLASLPRRNEWVFSSPPTKSGSRSKSGRIADARGPHERALKAAALPPLSIHGLRRSFGTLAEWVECPVGIVAQIMGHKPSAIAEKHYRRRPLDLLRMWHVKIEGWILEQAGIEQPSEEQTEGLRVVA